MTYQNKVLTHNRSLVHKKIEIVILGKKLQFWLNFRKLPIGYGRLPLFIRYFDFSETLTELSPTEFL